MTEARKKPQEGKTQKAIEWANITLGVAIAALSYGFFLYPNSIVIGGVSGISIIIRHFTGSDPAWLMLAMNVVFLVLTLIFLGKTQFVKTVYGAIMFPLLSEVFILIYDHFMRGTSWALSLDNLDAVIIILFSSLLMGLGLGVAMKYGASTGGTEVFQMIMTKYFHVPLSFGLYLFDGLVIMTGFFVGAMSLELMLYAWVYTYISGAIMDAVCFSGFNKRAVAIITKQPEAIKNAILDRLERGVSSIKIRGEFSKEDSTMLICVLSSHEYLVLRTVIDAADPHAFYFCVRASDVRGEGFSYLSKEKWL